MVPLKIKQMRIKKDVHKIYMEKLKKVVSIINNRKKIPKIGIARIFNTTGKTKSYLRHN